MSFILLILLCRHVLIIQKYLHFVYNITLTLRNKFISFFKLNFKYSISGSIENTANPIIRACKIYYKLAEEPCVHMANTIIKNIQIFVLYNLKNYYINENLFYIIIIRLK